MIYTIDYSTEEQLTSDVKNIIINKYEDYKITFFAKVMEDNREIWVVKLVGAKDYVIVRVEDGEMEEVENFQRAN